MATQAAIRQRVRNKLYSLVPPARPYVDRLNDTLSASAADTTVTVYTGTSWKAGDIVELPGGEQLYITGVATNDLTVIRAWNGTTLETAATGIVLLKNPRYDLATIDQSITDCLESLENLGVFTYGYGSLTLVAGQTAYQLTESDVLGVIGVYYKETTTLEPIPLPFNYSRKLSSTPFTNNHTLSVWDWGGKAAGDTLYYTYKKKIDSVTDLLARQDELVVWGAAYRMLLGTVSPETHDPGKRTDRTVQPGTTSRDASRLEYEFNNMVRLERAVLETEIQKLMPGNLQIGRARRWRGGA